LDKKGPASANIIPGSLFDNSRTPLNEDSYAPVETTGTENSYAPVETTKSPEEYGDMPSEEKVIFSPPKDPGDNYANIYPLRTENQ